MNILISGMLNIYYLCERVGLQHPPKILFKISWKTTVHLALDMTKCCLNLTLLHTDNQCLFLQLHVAIFVPASVGKWVKLSYLTSQIHFESHSSVKLYSVFYLKAKSIAKAPFCRLSSQDPWYMQHLWLLSPWCPSCRQVTESEFLLQIDTIPQPTWLPQISPKIQFSMLSWSVGSRDLVGNYQMYLMDMLVCWAVALPSTEQIVSTI